MRSAWHIEDEGALPLDASPMPATTVSLQFVRATVRRLWYVWLACALVGVSLAAVWLSVIPARSVGTVTLLLAHDPGAQPDTAMATDISLLRTRAVAEEVSGRLGLGIPPEDLQKLIVAVPTTSSVLNLDIAGDDPDDAVQRARTLGEAYLGFRKEQLSLQANAVIDGYRQRVEGLQAQVDDLTQQYESIATPGQESERATEILARRADLVNQVGQLEDSIESASLQVSAVVAASRVLDTASVVPQSSKRRAALTIASGLVGGLGLGLGLVLLYAVTTSRLRSRADVAAAFGVSVAFSAPRVSPRLGRPRARHRAALELLVDALATALPAEGRRPGRLGLINVGCEREGARVVAALAHRLAGQQSVGAFELGTSGLLARELGALARRGDAVPSQAVTVVTDPTTETVADVVLGLVSFEMGRGLSHVKSTTPRCVVLVKAGRSTAEGLRTVSQAARAAGLEVVFVMLVGADRADESFGGLSAREAPADRPSRV